MRHWKMTLSIAALCTWSAQASAEPSGIYSVTGSYPNGGTYGGEVMVEADGPSFNVSWDVSGDIFTGTGLSADDTLAIVYDSPASVPGVMQMNRTDYGWNGTWNYVGQDGTGTETWIDESRTGVLGTDVSGKENPIEALTTQFISVDGYEVQSLSAVNDAIEQNLTQDPDSIFWSSGDLSAFVKAVLALESSEVELERVRYRLRYGQQMVPQPPKAYLRRISIVQIDRFNIGPGIRQELVEELGSELVAPPAVFGEGPHISWRLLMSPTQGQAADIMAVSRLAIADGDAQAERCLGTPCLSLGSAGDDAVPWDEIAVPDHDQDATYQTERNGLLTPAAAIDMLTKDFSYEPREGLGTSEPFAEAVIEMNLGQDASLNATLREGSLMDDSVRAEWHSIGAQPSGPGFAAQFGAARAFECHRGPEFADPGEHCP